MTPLLQRLRQNKAGTCLICEYEVHKERVMWTLIRISSGSVELIRFASTDYEWLQQRPVLELFLPGKTDAKIVHISQGFETVCVENQCIDTTKKRRMAQKDKSDVCKLFERFHTCLLQKNKAISLRKRVTAQLRTLPVTSRRPQLDASVARGRTSRRSSSRSWRQRSPGTATPT